MKKRNFLSFTAILFLLAGLTITSCKKDEDPDPTDQPPGDTLGLGIKVTENISSDVTWETGKVYILGERITVLPGVTLTIEPGVIVKGEAGSGPNATALLVARGGKLMAEGTAEKPIIFTSVADEIEPGQVASPNLDTDMNGLWGGLIILGNAPISADAASVQIEGIPVSDQNGLYGGTKADDNSGKISYISIRHGGSNIGEGNEINGLTLGGVGSATTIHHVEVVANQDDGIECFGGTVDVSHVLIWNQGDDGFDMDQDYTGTIDNFIGIAGEESDHGLELDGPEGTQDKGGFTLKNGSLKGWNDDGTSGSEYADLRDGVKCTLENLYFFNYSDDSDFEIDDNDGSDNYKNGDIIISKLEFNVSHLTDGNTTIDDIMLDKSDQGDAFDGLTDDEAKVVTSASVGADKTKFASWTWADKKGMLADF
ncbi:MAG: hypothetical protein ACOCUL_01155 [Bacteroidota bacterium]